MKLSDCKHIILAGCPHTWLARVKNDLSLHNLSWKIPPSWHCGTLNRTLWRLLVW